MRKEMQVFVCFFEIKSGKMSFLSDGLYKIYIVCHNERMKPVKESGPFGCEKVCCYC